MKAAIQKDYGKIGDVVEIQNVPMPNLLPGTVMIEVHASSVNPIDNILIAGYMKNIIPLQFPRIVGNDVSGIVTDVAPDITRFKKGDAVFARPNSRQSGTFAEYIAVFEQDIALKPASISHAEAASIPLVGLTAWQGLIDKAHLQKGQKVLIHAGSGGVGSIAIQIAKHIGAHVATTTSTQNIEFVKKLGADEVVDYKAQDFSTVLKDYDVVFDMVAGAEQEKSFSILKKGGCLVSITGSPNASATAEKLGVRYELFFMQPSGAQLASIAQLMTEGKIKAVIDSTYPLEKIREALTHSASGRARGKIIVAVKP